MPHIQVVEDGSDMRRGEGSGSYGPSWFCRYLVEMALACCRFARSLLEALEVTTIGISGFGERHGPDWLPYNPLQLRAYHRLGPGHAPAVLGVILEVFVGVERLRVERLADVRAASGASPNEVRRHGRDAAVCEYALASRPYARRRTVRCRLLELRPNPPSHLRAPGQLHGFLRNLMGFGSG